MELVFTETPLILPQHSLYIHNSSALALLPVFNPLSFIHHTLSFFLSQHRQRASSFPHPILHLTFISRSIRVVQRTFSIRLSILKASFIFSHTSLLLSIPAPSLSPLSMLLVILKLPSILLRSLLRMNYHRSFSSHHPIHPLSLKPASIPQNPLTILPMQLSTLKCPF